MTKLERERRTILAQLHWIKRSKGGLAEAIRFVERRLVEKRIYCGRP